MNVRIIQCVTSVRVGDGASVTAVDLPLAREKHTRWPFVPGSAIKGALRARAEIFLRLDAQVIDQHFGSSAEASGPGSLRLGAATLLALPVRCLHGTFVLLTCPLALARLARTQPDAPPLPQVGEDWAAMHPKFIKMAVESGSSSLMGDREGIIFLEDMDWNARPSEAVQAWSAWLDEWLGGDAPTDRLCVVSDEVFAFASQYWTEVRTRNEIAPDGVVKDGHLFSTELLPSDTLLWTLIDQPPTSQVLPADGDSFAIGGHHNIGHGRVAWYSRRSQ